MHDAAPIDRTPRHRLALLAGTALLVVHTGAVHGQEPGTISGEQLQEALQERDAVIIRLQQRLDALERQLEEQGLVEPEVEEAAPADVAAPPSRGMLDVDELAAERALERTLVDVGAVLLRAGQAELSPSFTFTRGSEDFPVLAGTNVVEVRGERSRFDFGLGLSLGLPFDSQFELDVPYEIVYEENKFRIGGGAQDTTDATGRAIGDVSVGFAKTLLRENGGWQPDVVGRATYDAPTGERVSNDVVLGNGFHRIRGELVAIKRQDPIAFIGSLGYRYTFEDDDIEPGQQFSMSLGASLAVSPETSLNVSLSQTYSDELELDSTSIDGSDQLAASFNFGGSAIIAPRLLLRLNTSIGLTDDSNDYSLRTSLAYRFNTPVF